METPVLNMTSVLHEIREMSPEELEKKDIEYKARKEQLELEYRMMDLIKEHRYEEYANVWRTSLDFEHQKFQVGMILIKIDMLYRYSSYVKIDDDYSKTLIELGQDVVPILIQVLQDDDMLIAQGWQHESMTNKCPLQIFNILAVITKENPVSENHQGNIKLMRHDWIHWWSDKETVDDF